MTRIIAGAAGGRRLRVPATARPTSDRVREALFSRLDHLGVVADAVVWDLFAGSGALGLEAASRGAARVVLVESDRAAAATCRRNAADLGLTQVEVVAQKVAAFLAGGPDQATLVLADPPYRMSEPDLTGTLQELGRHLATGAVVVVERSSREPEPTWPPGLRTTEQRRYGDTALWFATTAAA